MAAISIVLISLPGKNYDFLFSLVPLITYAIVSKISIIKHSVIQAISFLYHDIECIFSGKSVFEEQHKEYKIILNEINSGINFLFKIKKIISLKQIENKYQVIRASDFHVEVKLPDKLKAFKNGEYFQLNDIYIDGVFYNNCYCYRCESGFIHIVVFEKGARYQKLLHNDSFKMLFDKIGKYLEFETEISSRRLDYVKKLRDNMEFIQASELVVHYIKNKLQPISAFLEIFDDISSNDHFKLMPEPLQTQAITEHSRSRITLDQILRRSESLLYQKRKIDYFDLYYISFISLFHNITSHILQHDGKIEIETKIEFNEILSFACTNEDGLSLVIEELLVNSKKYHRTYYKVVFIEQDNFFKLSFENDFNPIKIENIKIASRALTDIQAEETLSRTNSGLVTTKKICAQMGITLECLVNKFVFQINLNLKKYTPENLNEKRCNFRQ
jgi:two-component sensor histidine kinase